MAIGIRAMRIGEGILKGRSTKGVWKENKMGRVRGGIVTRGRGRGAGMSLGEFDARDSFESVSSTTHG